jgi:vitellogenic carboxypeptidase-like protein
MRSPLKLLLTIAACACCFSAAAALRDTPEQLRDANLPNPTHAGYLPVQNALGSAMYYAYFEAEHPHPNKETAPIVLWLQVGTRAESKDTA